MDLMDYRRKIIASSPHLSHAEGAIATFADGTDLPLKSLLVNIAPVQDLHGYDYPWVAGGGINKLPPMVDGTYTGNGLTAVVKDGVATLSGTSTASGNALIIPLAEEYTVTEGYLHLCNSVANASFAPTLEDVNAISASNVSFACSPVNRVGAIPANRIGQKWNRIRVWIGSGITISGTYAPMVCEDNTVRQYAPYENLCPIIGWDAAKMTKTGKNLLGGLPMAQAIVNAVGNATYSKQVSDDTGDYVTIKASSYTNNKVFTSGVKFKSNTQYTVILKVTRNIVGTSVSSNISVRYTDGTYKIITFAESTGTEIVTVAFVTDGAKTVKHIETSWGGGTSKIYYDECGIFEGVLTASDFVPYTGTTITVQLGRTVYGGTLNVLTGELVVDRYFVDPSQWTRYNASNGYIAYRIQGIPNGRYANDASNKPLSNIIAKFGSFSSSAMSENIIQPPRIQSDSTYLALQDGIDSATVELSYLMLNPITYHLDPQTVRSLVGRNNIFADTGNVALDYWAHP